MSPERRNRSRIMYLKPGETPEDAIIFLRTGKRPEDFEEDQFEVELRSRWERFKAKLGLGKNNA